MQPAGQDLQKTDDDDLSLAVALVKAHEAVKARLQLQEVRTS